MKALMALMSLSERLDEFEEWFEELDRDSGEELRWELDDLHHRSVGI